MKLIFILTAALVLSSCGSNALKNENGVCFDSDKIAGKYELSLLDFVRESMKNDTIDTEAKGFVYGLASLIRFNVSFYENNKGAFSNSFSSKPEVFEYKVENDSILYVKTDSSDYKKVGVIHKFTDNFDFISIKCDSLEQMLNLKKVSE